MLNKFKKLGYFIGIITYNCFANIVVKETNLQKYMNYIVYGDLDRNVLFLTENKDAKYYDIYYVDDRIDNLQIIKEYFPNTTTYH